MKKTSRRRRRQQSLINYNDRRWGLISMRGSDDYARKRQYFIKEERKTELKGWISYYQSESSINKFGRSFCITRLDNLLDLLDCVTTDLLVNSQISESPQR